MKNVLFRDLGSKPYKETWDYQEGLLKAKVAAKSLAAAGTGDIPEEPQPADTLLFVEHPAVYTLGTNGKQTNVLLNPEQLAQKGIEYYHINRGGDITFHGPGQIVGYPIIDLEHFKTDLGWYLRSLEEMIILTVAEYGLKGERSPGETGVWLDTAIKGRERKVCAMGIRCSRWVTMHGFALNVNTSLDYFNFIIPCGIQNKQVTSLAKELGHELPIEEVKASLQKNFEKVFGVTLVQQASPV